jgi:DNA repair photolyase
VSERPQYSNARRKRATGTARESKPGYPRGALAEQTPKIQIRFMDRSLPNWVGPGRRGAISNPANRFSRLYVEPVDPLHAAADPGTVYLRDTSRSIIARNDSPDVGFDATLNPYRGCSHGCSYCYARPGHEYLGFSAGLDFETKILVKQDAPSLLRSALSSSRWIPRPLLMSGVTDPYQSIERDLRITRGCLEVLAEFRNPVAVITKGALVERDVDVLGELAAYGAACAIISVTTLRDEIHRAMEPRAATPRSRLRAIESLSRAGVPVRVNVAPVVPGITDHEIPSILKAAAGAGATSAVFIPLRLPRGVAALFDAWLERHFPDRRAKVLERVRSMRGGRLNDPRFGHRMRGQGPFAKQIRDMFDVHRRRHGLARGVPDLSTAAFRSPVAPTSARRRPTQARFPQIELFED